MAPMTRAVVLTCLLLRCAAAPRATPPLRRRPRLQLRRPVERHHETLRAARPQRPDPVLRRRASVRRRARSAIGATPRTTTEPGLFVHSKERNRWLQILAISTAGGRLGRSWTDDPQAQRKLRTAPVGWDFTPFAGRPYIDQPLKTTGSVAFPDRITFDEASGQYELRYFSSFGVPSAETVLFIRRADLARRRSPKR